MKLNSGRLLRAFMDERGLSNADIALAAGVNRTFISALVNGRRTSCTPKVAQRIERRLGIPEGVLFVPRPSADSIQNNRRARGNEVAA